MSNELKAIESHLNDSAHHEEAEAFMEVDWYVSEYLKCPKSDLHESAFELRKLVGDIVESWNSRPIEPKTKIAEGQSFNAHWIGEESCRDYQIGNITLRDIPDKFVIRNTKFSGGSLLVKGQVDEFIAKCKIDVSVGDGKISVICDEVNK